MSESHCINKMRKKNAIPSVDTAEGFEAILVPNPNPNYELGVSEEEPVSWTRPPRSTNEHVAVSGRALQVFRVRNESRMPAIPL